MTARTGKNVRAAGVFLAVLFTIETPGLAPDMAGRVGPQRPAAGAASLSVEQWSEDIDVLAAELPKRHKSLYDKISKAEFMDRVGRLKKGLPALSPDEILAGLMKLVAGVGDSHTTLGYRTQRGIPLMTYWFKDGIHVLNTTSEFKAVLHGRITAVGRKPIDEVITLLTTVIPHENEAQVRTQLPNLLVDTALLHGLNVLSSPESAVIAVTTPSGEIKEAAMRPLSFASNPAWLVDISDESGAPLYLKNRRLFYWYEVLADSRTLYFKYNSCREMKGKPFADFVREMFEAADAGGVRRVVIDLRHNGGGNSAIFRPFLTGLKKRKELMEKGRVLVLVGRRTFSSAILNALELKKETPAVFAGEPTGGKPNHYGEVQAFKLPNSGLAVTYSTKFFRVVDDDPESLIPDLLIEPTLREYLEKTDPVLEAVLDKQL